MIKLYNKHQVAEMFGVSYKTIEAWQREGQLSYYKFSNGPRGAVRYSPDDISSLLSKVYIPAKTAEQAAAK